MSLQVTSAIHSLFTQNTFASKTHPIGVLSHEQMRRVGSAEAESGDQVRMGRTAEHGGLTTHLGQELLVPRAHHLKGDKGRLQTLREVNRGG